MFYFLSKLGRLKAAKYVMPTISAIATGSYYLSQTYLHDHVRDFLAARESNGQRETLSDHICTLISDVYSKCREDLCKVPFAQKKMLTDEPKYKWFAASTLEPVIFGQAEFKTGTLIGLPIYYNYENADQIPKSFYVIREMNLFRQKKLTKDDFEDEPDIVSDQPYKAPVIVKKRIKPDSDEGKAYTESLLLSDDARRFVIARQIFLGDTYLPLSKTVLIMCSFLLSYTSSSAAITKLNRRNAHVSHRIPFYLLGGILGFGLYTFIESALKEQAVKNSEDRAIALGESYKKGYEEFKSKQEQRHKIITASA